MKFITESDRYDSFATEIRNNKATLGHNLPLVLMTPYECYVKKICELINENSNVLEVAAGTGDWTLPLLNTNCSLTCADLSSKSLELLEERFADHDNSLSTSLQDMQRLSFEDNSFDFICCAGGLSYGDNDIVLKEFHRVVKPGGYIICVDSLDHNPIYRLNRFLHFVRGNRGISTLKRMPTLSLIRSYSEEFNLQGVHFFGTFSWLILPLDKLFSSVKLKNISDKLDKINFLKFLAFKFVLCVQKKK